MSPKVAEMPSARPTGAKARTNARRVLLSLSGRRWITSLQVGPRSGASVRRNPKATLLGKLGHAKALIHLRFRRIWSRWHEDAVPDGT